MAKKEVDINLSVKGIHDLEKANEVLEKIKFEKKKIEAQADTLGRSVTKLAAGYVTVDKAVSFVKGSIEEFQKLEKANLKLEAASRAVGASFEQNKQKVAKLAEDGALAIGQVSDNFATLIKSGLDAQKAFDLIDASKKLGTFASATGNASDAVADLVNGLLTGEEQLFNIDPSLKQFAKSLGGGEKVAGDLATKMQFVNEVIRRGNELTADYAAAQDTASARAQRLNVSFTKLQATVGQKLAPAFNALALALSDTFNWLEKNVSATLDYIKLLPGLGQILRIFETIGEIQKDNQNAALAEQVEIMGKLDAVVRSGLASEETKAELLKKQGQLLGGIGKAYRDVFVEAQRAGMPLAEQLNLLNQLKTASQVIGQKSDAELQSNVVGARAAIDRIASKQGGAQGAADADQIKQFAALMAASQEELDRRKKSQAGAAFAAGGGGAPKRSDFLLSGLTESLTQNQRALDAFTDSIDGAGKAAEGAARKLELDTLAIQQASDAAQSYYKDSLSVALTGAEREYEAAIALDKDLEKNKKGYVSQSLAIEEAYERKKLQIQLDYANQAVQALSSINTAAISALKSGGGASAAAGASGILGAAGSAASSQVGKDLGLGALGGLAVVGAVAGIGAAIVGLIESDAEEASRKEKQRAAERERRRQELWEAEIRHDNIRIEKNKLLLSLENQLEQLAREKIDLEIRMASLGAKSQTEILKLQRGGEYAKAQDILQSSNVSGGAQSAFGFIAGEAGKVGATAGQKIEFLGGFIENKVKEENAIARMQNFLSSFKFGTSDQGYIDSLNSLRYLKNSDSYKQLPDYAKIEVDKIVALALKPGTDTQYLEKRAQGVNLSGATQTVQSQRTDAQLALESLVSAQELDAQLSTQKFADALALIERQAQAGGSAFDKTGALQKLANKIGKSLGITDLSTINADTAKLFGTAGAEAENFQMLLDLMEQIKDATKETAENTATTLTDRQLTFSDIGRGGRVSGGLFETLDSLSFRVPSGIQSVAVATGAAGGGGNPQLADISANTRAAAQLLGDIAAQLRAGNVVSIESLIRQGIANANGGNTL